MFYDDYTDHSYSMLRSHMRVRVTAPTSPPITRAFDMPQRASEAQLIDAFRLAIGHPELGDAHEYESYEREVRSLSFGADRTIDIPDVAEGCWIDVLNSRDLEVGEPCVQIVDDDDPSPASMYWQSAPAPLRSAHVQHELTRTFGLVQPKADSSHFDELPRSSSLLVPLLHELPLQRRLALRAHLADAVLPGPSAMNSAMARELLSGASWLIDRLGREGVEQDEHGGFPNWLAREAEAAMDWMSTAGSPPSPGHALLALARAARFTRRLRGSIVTTAKGRAITDKPLRALDEIPESIPSHGRLYNWGSNYGWGPNHARTLALLAIADGSGADVGGVIERVTEGLHVLRESDDAHDNESTATRAVHALMEAFAPLGGVGHYGMLTPTVRIFARRELL